MNTIKIQNGDYSIEVLDQGAILYSFSYKDQDIILGFENKEDNIDSDSYFSQIVGPYANRIGKGAYTDGEGKHSLEINDVNNHLHSGSRNYGFKKWDIVEVTKDSVKLFLFSPEGQGFPGNHRVYVTYTMKEGGVLRIDYRIETDKRCPLNPTNHAFFNLSGGGDVRDSILTMDSDRYIEVDNELIPTKIKSVEGTDFDYRKPMKMGSRRNGAYDHCFILQEGGKVRVENQEYALEMRTSLPSVQFYTSGMLKRKEKGKKGEDLIPYTGFCLESEYYPDYPNREDFQGFWGDKDHPYESWTEYKLEKK